MFHNVNLKYVPDLLRSNFHLAIHKYYWLIHAIYATILWNIDPFALVYAWLVPAVILWHAGSSINTFSHSIGWQDHQTKDTSTNHWFNGIIMWGEGWHNNHHAFPADYRFGKKWYEIDITAYIIEWIKK
jgi:stearoyl-CoA desaturase (delta-9 desaturase)